MEDALGADVRVLPPLLYAVPLLVLWLVHLAVPLIVVAVDRLVIAREEIYLRRRFGPAYEDFSARVRRWL